MKHELRIVSSIGVPVLAGRHLASRDAPVAEAGGKMLKVMYTHAEQRAEILHGASRFRVMPAATARALPVHHALQGIERIGQPAKVQRREQLNRRWSLRDAMQCQGPRLRRCGQREQLRRSLSLLPRSSFIRWPLLLILGERRRAHKVATWLRRRVARTPEHLVLAPRAVAAVREDPIRKVALPSHCTRRAEPLVLRHGL